MLGVEETGQRGAGQDHTRQTGQEARREPETTSAVRLLGGEGGAAWLLGWAVPTGEETREWGPGQTQMAPGEAGARLAGGGGEAEEGGVSFHFLGQEKREN